MSCRSEFIPWGVLLKVGIQSGINPLLSQCVQARTHISQDYLAQPLNPHSLEQRRVLLQFPQAARSRENKMRCCPSRVSWAAQGARDKAGPSGRAAGPIHIRTVLVSFSSATVATLHFWRLCQREKKWQFKAIKILEGLKRIFILSKVE